MSSVPKKAEKLSLDLAVLIIRLYHHFEISSLHRKQQDCIYGKYDKVYNPDIIWCIQYRNGKDKVYFRL